MSNSSWSEKWTTITVPKEVVEHLKKVRIHRREPYYDAIERLIKEHQLKKEVKQ